jgi:SPP1 family predicted phage head-tail adaptor
MPDDIGALRERVEVKQVTATRSEEGEMVVDWNTATTLTTIWARCKFLPGRKIEEAHRMNKVASVQMTVRYRQDITEAMRILWRSNQWSIVSIEPDEEKIFMDLMVAKAE